MAQDSANSGEVDAADSGDPIAPRKTMSQREVEGWEPLRQQLYAITNSQRFDSLMGAVIMANVIVLLSAANSRAECYPEECESDVYKALDLGFLMFYILEAMARAYVARERYFDDAWNCVDLFVVVTGIIDIILGEVEASNTATNGLSMLTMLRILRILRLVRAIRLLRIFPELNFMVKGFLAAMKAMWWGFVLIMVTVVLWAYVCVEIVHPINKDMFANGRTAERPMGELHETCEEVFAGIWNACLYFFQTLVAGDAWGECTMPVIQENQGTFIIFALALVSVMLGFMNLILAVIVDHANQARERDNEEKLREKKSEQAVAVKKWAEVIKSIDDDGSGTISREELLAGYENPGVRETLNVLGIDKDDLNTMFELMDDDCSGDLDYGEFINTLIKAQGQDLRIYLMMTRLQMDAVARTAKGIASDMGQARKSLRKSSAAEAAASQVATDPAAVSLSIDLQKMQRRIQDEFEALAQRIDLEFNSVALSQDHAQVLEAAIAEAGPTLSAEGMTRKAAQLRLAAALEKASTSRPSLSSQASTASPQSPGASSANGRAGRSSDPQERQPDPEPNLSASRGSTKDFSSLNSEILGILAVADRYSAV